MGIYKNNLIIFLFSILVLIMFLYIGPLAYVQVENSIIRLIFNVVFALNIFLVIPITIGNVIHLIIKAFRLKKALIIPIILIVLSIAFMMVWLYVIAQVGMSV